MVSSRSPLNRLAEHPKVALPRKRSGGESNHVGTINSLGRAGIELHQTLRVHGRDGPGSKPDSTMMTARIALGDL